MYLIIRHYKHNYLDITFCPRGDHYTSFFFFFLFFFLLFVSWKFRLFSSFLHDIEQAQSILPTMIFISLDKYILFDNILICLLF